MQQEKEVHVYQKQTLRKECFVLATKMFLLSVVLIALFFFIIYPPIELQPGEFSACKLLMEFACAVYVASYGAILIRIFYGGMRARLLRHVTYMNFTPAVILSVALFIMFEDFTGLVPLIIALIAYLPFRNRLG